jgi:hypothetical protein
MEEIKEDIEQVKVQILTGIKLGRVEKEWGNMIIETCNRALTIPVVVQVKPEKVCKGSWQLGNNCKKCKRCLDTKPS